MEVDNKILNAFDGILENLVEGNVYGTKPPRGPSENVPSVSDEALRSTEEDIYGQDEREEFGVPQGENAIRLCETPQIKAVELPDTNELDKLNIIGITGANSRILTTSFHLILARSSIVNFRYTSGFEKPYFYTKSRDASALLVLDDNIFDSNYSIHTYNDLVDQTKSFPIYDHLNKQTIKPYRFRYDHEKSKKAPNSQSLGLAVKFQHALELVSIADTEIERDGPLVCIKDGALFSNSTSITDIRNGLQKLSSWSGQDKFFIAVSEKVSESRVLIKTLNELPELIEEYFPNQNITIGLINSFGTDTLLLKKILRPGFRTPLIEYIEKTREGIINNGLEGFKPVTCYYHKRSKPYGFIRLEMPKFMWEENKELADFAIKTAIWQYELGIDSPLVIKAAHDRCNLSHDRWVIEQQMKAAFERRKLELIEF